MRIDRIELPHIRMELVTPFETSMGTEKDEGHIIVRIDGEGLGVRAVPELLEKVTVRKEVFGSR